MLVTLHGSIPSPFRILLLIGLLACGQGHGLRAGSLRAFSNLSVEDGLSQGTIYCIFQDSYGFMWFGTRDGLNRFDGYEFKVFRNRSDRADSLPDNAIHSIVEPRPGYLWLGTEGGGIAEMDLATERFRIFKHDPDRERSLSSDYIKDMMVVENGDVWVATFKGLNRYRAEDGVFERIRLTLPEGKRLPSIRVLAESPSGHLFLGCDQQGLLRLHPDSGVLESIGHPSGLPADDIEALHADGYGALWVGTGQDGLFHARKASEPFRAFAPSNAMPRRVLSVLQDRRGAYWVGTEDQGLFHFDPQTTTWQHKPLRPAQRDFSASTIILSLLEDRTGVIWIGTDGDGIYRLNPQSAQFGHLMEGVVIRCFAQEDARSVWVGTFGHGLFHLALDGAVLEQYHRDNVAEHGFDSNSTMSVCVDRSGRVWAGSDGNGLFMRERKGMPFEAFQHDPEDPESISGNNIWSIYEDRAHRIWVGTEFHGLNLVNPTRPGRFTRFRADGRPGSISDDEVWVIYQDREDRLWVGTEHGGLNLFLGETRGFRAFRADPHRGESLSSDHIKTVYQDSHHRLWVGTTQGLNLFHGEERGFTAYHMRDGLPNNVVYSVLEDEAGFLWVSTNKGIAKFDPNAVAFETYSAKDGLQDNEFNTGAYLEGIDGRFFLGGVNGFNEFFPGTIEPDRMPPAIVLTELLIYNRKLPIEVPRGDRGATTTSLPRALFAMDEIVLGAKDRMVTFAFAGLHFANPQQNRYLYKLEGIDDHWIETHGANRRATYTHLPAGEYRFMVKAANQDGVWNETPARIHVRVLPPWWWSRWAQFGYAVSLLLLGCSYVFRQKRIQRYLASEVAARTSDLRQKNQELRTVDKMVRAINSVASLTNFLRMLVELLPFRGKIQRARALTYDPYNDYFCFQGVLGWDEQILAPIQIGERELRERYVSLLKELQEDLFCWTVHMPGTGERALFGTEIPASILVLRVRDDQRTWGYLLFENMEDPHAFSDLDFSFMPLLKQHLVSAFSKTRILEDLKRLNVRKNEFLGIVAHDLRSPISGLIMWAQCMRETIQSEEMNIGEHLEMLDKFERTTREMERLLKELLDISAIEAGTVRLELDTVDLAQITEEVVLRYSHAARKKNITLALDPPETRMLVYADGLKLSEILDNLISNAVKYSYPDGHVRVSFDGAGEFVTTSVRDVGQGMTHEDKQKVFGAFTKLSARPTGGESSTGLGLAIVKKLVAVQGGKVWVESEKGKGSCFSFTLPASDEVPPAEAEPYTLSTRAK
ncbi:Histidine kinase domain-containing protein [Sulfidibacter corallicola]|uniref:histidine kinase n=1 Tax=Sulfidibacter corallicola TaxID=2818388 RepID=A0A8A4TJP0_SULCO|nr:sensor histidine kinase [Sulfidibacter corallicola]QTD49071.1 hypothetical protein J3U87_26085 [Sulfidibacter corallicola]